MDFTATHKVETVVKSFHIIERLNDLGCAGVSELSKELDISKSIVHNHLSTLRELGYVRKVKDEYRLSLRFLELGVDIRNQSPQFHSIEQKAWTVARQFETGVYIIEGDGESGVVTQVFDQQPAAVPDLSVGDRLGLLESPLGKALLSVLSESTQTAAIEAAGEVPDQYHASTQLDKRLYAGYLTSDESEKVVARGLRDGVVVGAVGVRIPENAGEDIEQAIRTATSSMAETLSDVDEEERSFATTKHSWFSD